METLDAAQKMKFSIKVFFILSVVRTMCEICSKLTIKTPERRRHWRSKSSRKMYSHCKEINCWKVNGFANICGIGSNVATAFYKGFLTNKWISFHDDRIYGRANEWKIFQDVFENPTNSKRIPVWFKSLICILLKAMHDSFHWIFFSLTGNSKTR